MTHLPPDAAIATLTFGIGLIYWELNRPGNILPGAFGLLCVLLSLAELHGADLRYTGIGVATSAGLLLGLAVRVQLPALVSTASIAALILGLYLSVRTSNTPVHVATSLVCGAVIGTGSSWLAAIARRARLNKQGSRGGQGLD